MRTGPATPEERAQVFQRLVLFKSLPPIPELDEITDDSVWFRRVLRAIRVNDGLRANRLAKERMARMRASKKGDANTA